MLSIETLSHDDAFDAYVAEPAQPPRAAIIVIQEIFGVNRGIRAKCDAWAEAGYLSLAPDLFWRSERGIELDPDVPDDFSRALGILGAFDRDLAVRDLEATIRAARARVNGGKVGIVGFCMGGLLSYLAATRTDADASVGYYGGGIHEKLSEAHAIAKPLMLHFAEQDHFIGPEARAAIHAALDGNRHVTIHEYPGVDHGFADTFGKRRDDDAALAADVLTSTFFAEHLA